MSAVKNKNYTVDIIIPFYEHHDALKKLLKSLNKLNLKKIDLKILIIIDGSKINKSKLKKKCKYKINFIDNKKNMGVSFSRNIGVKRSNAEFIWFLDSDAEIINKNTIQNAIKFLKKDVTGITGTVELIDNKKTYLVPKLLLNGFILYEKLNSKKSFVNKNFEGTSLFMKRKTFLKVGYFDNKLKVHEEYEWLLGLKKEDRKFIFIPKCFVLHNNFKIERNKYSLDYFNMIISTRAKIFKKHYKNQFRFLFIYDLITFPYIFIRLKIIKNFISTRFTSKSGVIDFHCLFFILKRLFISYLI